MATDALAAQVRLFRSAVLAGASQSAARSTALMEKHNALVMLTEGRPWMPGPRLIMNLLGDRTARAPGRFPARDERGKPR